MKTELDHLVIGAATLEQGQRYVREKLGIDIQFGGTHPRMGTHNCLARLGERTFLEVIAVDPEADSPEQPRWFGLDDIHIKKCLSLSPRLLTWVVNTPDITETLESSTIACGNPWSVSRGDLQWQFGVPDDGRLLAGGMLPYIISWPTDKPHPASSMEDSGCRLHGFKLHTPFAEWTEINLLAIGARPLVDLIPLPPGSTPYLEIEVETPTGIRLLRSFD